LKLLKKLFPSLDEPAVDDKSDVDQLKLATCILLIEVSKSDDDYDINEQIKIKSLLKEKFQISDDEINDLYMSSDKKHDSMTSLYDWTEIINSECSYEQKLIIIGFMWDIAFIDSKIDKYEDFTIRKVADLIYVKHKDFISLKNERAT
tara:strand:+ start:154 stop:597 length:444 start_codon:yes stop_codon:yes gene_type:complete